MTLTTPYQASFYVGDGETKAFPFVFEELSDNFVKVIVSHIDGTTSIPTYIVDLDLKQVVFGDETPAPTADDVVCIYRETPTIQDTPFKTLEGYNAKALENILSKIVAMIQEIKSNYFSTQVLQGEPWQLDLLKSADDGATVNIDYVAKKLVKGLYFQITDGNLQVSADGGSYITMPKSSDVAELRQQVITLSDLTVIKKLQYRVNNEWFDAETNAQATADEALALAQSVESDLSSHTTDLNNPHATSMGKLTDTDIDAPTAGQFIMFDGLKWKNVYSSATASWGTIIGNITDQTDLMNKFTEYVRTDGTSVMTAPLLMRATDDFKCAIAPYWDGVGFFKLNDNNSVTLIASIEYQDSFAPAENNVYNIGSTSKKWKNLYLAGTAYLSTINNGGNISVPTTSGTMALTSDIAFKSTDVELTTLASGQFLMYDGSKWINTTQGYANTDLSNLTSTGKNISNWSTNVSNCITEIPQDINLTLSNGTLTLKAGSKVYIPNGVGVFDEVVIANDITPQGVLTDDDIYAVYANTSQQLWTKKLSGFVSGDTTPPAINDGIWYNTTANRIEWYTGSAWSGNGGRSFPIAIVSRSSGTITSIDQVFNGFGYIGSTVFALPGVKGLYPDGRNADGTLKSGAINISTILTYTVSNTAVKAIRITSSSLFGYQGYIVSDTKPSVNFNMWYNPSENIMYDTGAGTASSMNASVAGSVNYDGTRITSFNPKTVFHAVDYSDIKNILELIYPVGAIYIGTQNTCPMSILMPGTTWEIVATDRALWGGNGTNANTTIAAGLPNITGSYGNGGKSPSASDAFYLGTSYGATNRDYDSSDGAKPGILDASRSSSVYGNSTTVQPPAYRVNVWRRVS